MLTKFILSAFTCFLFFSFNTRSHPPDTKKDSKQIRTLINLLDYIDKDYSNAVEKGRITNTGEYKEMVEFSRQATAVFKQIDAQIGQKRFSQLGTSIESLQKAIQEKKSSQQISGLVSDIRNEIVALNLIDVAPTKWPDLQNGAKVFGTYCQSCHGKDGFGDGPLAADLTPAPSNFHDSALVSKLSPLQIYNTIRLGIQGTGMRSFRELTNQQAWDVAFFINSLQFKDPVPASERQTIVEALKDTTTLRTLATTTNHDWYAYLEERGLDVDKAMTVLRGMEKGVEGDGKELLKHSITLLKNALEAYSSSAAGRANALALNAYLDGIEPLESQIKAIDPLLASRIETRMMDVRSAIKSEVSVGELQRKVDAAIFSIEEAQNIVGTKDYSFWFTFIVSGSILLREGLEAFLIILVILSVLKSVRAEKTIKYVHGGWIIALLIGIISWFFAESLISMGSFQREMMEGIGSLVAVALLLHVGFWLHNKSHASQWTTFIKEKIHRLADSDNRWGLAFLSFVVVFREAFESVIFLSSISIKSASAGSSGILLGTITALVIVFILGIILLKFAKSIPIQALFKYSSIMMGLLAVILVGKGIHEFQEAGYLGINMLPIYFDLPTIGLYSTLQTFTAQLIIAGTIIALWYYSNYRVAVQETR